MSALRKKTMFANKHLRFKKALLATAVAVGCVTPLMAAELSGRVLDSREVLLSGVQVSIPALKLSKVTGHDGRFAFANLPEGNYQLVLSYAGRSQQQQQVQLSGDLALGDLSLAVDSNIDKLTVQGQLNSASKALSQQRFASGIVSVATTDELGQFPDKNLSESLARLAGLSVEPDQGEGRFIRVRGLAPDYNTVTYNGTQLAAPEAGRRAVALDVIPSDLLASVEVSKTIAPEQAAGSLGGTVDIKAISAFDRRDNFYSLSGEGSYNQQQSETSPKFSGVATGIFDIGADKDALGVAFSASYADRKFGSDNVETGGSWDLDDEALEEFEQRQYSISRKRQGAALNLDYRPGGDTDYYLRTLYSEFVDTEVRQSLATEFSDPIQAGTETGAELVRGIKAREESQSISAVVLGMKQQLDVWFWSLEGGMSKADEVTPYSLADGQFETEFEEGVTFLGGDIIRLQAPDGAYEAGNYELKEVEVADTRTEEREHNIKLDFGRDLLTSWGAVELKAGVKISDRKKTADESLWLFEDLEDAGVSALSLADYSHSNARYGLDQFGPAVDPVALMAMLNSLDNSDYLDDVESQINDFRVDEQINAAYLQGNWQGEGWQVVAGSRYEHEQRDAFGSEYNAIDEEFSPRTYSGSEAHWLPALISKFELSDNSLLRAAATTSLVRPNFAQLAPAFLLEEDDDEVEASFGNPALKSLRSTNLDLGMEYYPDQLGVMSATLFYKDIEDFVYATDLAGYGDYAGFKAAETYVNGDDATLYGLELNLVQQLKGLGGFWQHFLLSANLTLTGSDAQISWYDDGERMQRDIDLPSQSDRTANLALGYEDEQWSLRLAANYKSEYLVEVSELDDARYDLFSDAQLQWDFSAKYKFSPALQLYFNAVNLTDEPYYNYTGKHQFNAQYEEYGRTFAFGVQLSRW
ncbi:TonB-dependent receptor [Rheinheimera sp.]|uniref:TonB-dependent receptor n=1 Tax=Rheinheimera sp. TaxID=1869214 RepID=UPI003AFA0132